MPCLNGVKVETRKLVGVTTDGENANTGKNGGLWKLLKEHTAWERYPDCMACLLSLRFSFRVCAISGSRAVHLDV